MSNDDSRHPAHPRGERALTTITELLAAAITGNASLTGPDGAQEAITLTAATRVAAAVDEDRVEMGLGLLDAGTAPVELEELWDGAPIIRVSALRYLFEEDYRLTRLCTAPGCHGESLGRRTSTRVCEDHLNVILPGMLPNAGDDILPGDREAAARESRARRLDVLDEEIAEAERDVRGNRSRAQQLRHGN